MSDQETDALLRRFLLEDARARAKGITIEALYGAVQKVASDRLADRKETADTMGRYGRRLRNVERQLEAVSEKPDLPDWRPDPREITGTHDLAVIKAQHDEMRADRQWWRQSLGKAAIGIAAALCVAGVSGCVGYVYHSVTTAAPMAVPTPK